MAAEVRPYMHRAILLLVESHVRVNDTAPTLVNRVLEALVTGVTEVALQSFQQIPKYGTGGMLTVSTSSITFRIAIPAPEEPFRSPHSGFFLFRKREPGLCVE